MFESPASKISLAVPGSLLIGAVVAWFGIVEAPPRPEQSLPEIGPGFRSPAVEKARTSDQTVDAAGQSFVLPSFDVVRVEPTGHVVIAGRSTPNVKVQMILDGRVYAETVADDSGSFTFVPPTLPSGAHQFVLATKGVDGIERRSHDSVTVVLSQDRTTKPLVAFTSPDTPTAVLSFPGMADRASQLASNPVKIASVDAQGGALIISGVSDPGAVVQLYLNDAFVGSGSANADGTSSFAIAAGGVEPRVYRLRLDEVDASSGRVKTRAEVNFTVPAEPSGTVTNSGAPGVDVATGTGTVVVPGVTALTVSHRDNLWRISQRVYGKGLRYTEIYLANQKQIRNPDLIHPGQVFVLPSR